MAIGFSILKRIGDFDFTLSFLNINLMLCENRDDLWSRPSFKTNLYFIHFSYLVIQVSQVSCYSNSSWLFNLFMDLLYQASSFKDCDCKKWVQLPTVGSSDFPPFYHSWISWSKHQLLKHRSSVALVNSLYSCLMWCTHSCVWISGLFS